MEKIYMDDNGFNNQQKQKQSQKGKYHFSIVLSFIVAVMAIASLVVVGFDQVSYAADTPDLGQKFTLKAKKHSDEKAIRIEGTGSGATTQQVYMYETDSHIPVFCIQHGVLPAIDVNDGYTKGENIGDNEYGILYILNKSGIYGGDGILPKDLVDSNSYEYYESYATQIALWAYLKNKYPNDANHEIDINNLKKLTNFSVSTTSTADIVDPIEGKNLYTQYIEPVVAAANDPKIKVKETKVWFDDKNLSEIDGSDYYQTSAINVSGKPSDDLESYSLSLSGVDGAFFVDENGEKLKDEQLTSIVPNSKKMYVRIPKDKVSSEAKTLRVTARGTFKNYLTGTKYVSADSQTVVTVTSDKHDESDYDEIPVVGAPDTGMSKAKTIYFIGLIVLLCGVGIIYASSKPIKEN